jgi:hypothetical protein
MEQKGEARVAAPKPPWIHGSSEIETEQRRKSTRLSMWTHLKCRILTDEPHAADTLVRATFYVRVGTCRPRSRSRRRTPSYRTQARRQVKRRSGRPPTTIRGGAFDARREKCLVVFCTDPVLDSPSLVGSGSRPLLSASTSAVAR